MRQEQFEAQHHQAWTEFEYWLKQHGKMPHLSNQDWIEFEQSAKQQGKRKNKQTAPIFHPQELPQRYRLLCQQLAVARARNYSLSLIERLHYMVVQGHDIIYSGNNGLTRRFVRYISGGFAADVRQAKYWVLLSTLLLMGPWLLMMLTIHFYPNFVFIVLAPETVNDFESMYSQTQSQRAARLAVHDWQMFGIYIYNNIGIAFSSFAGGLLAGLGTIFTLIYNGVTLGAMFARAETVNLTDNLYGFVSGHFAFEIGGIIIAGAAGLKLGWSVLVPGNLPRSASIRLAAGSLSGMIGGSAVMLFVAAIIEAFWSSRTFLLGVKLSVGIGLLILLMLYFIFAGRRNAA
jgi:uncharacterized membrane protein SpoIIM required for sporulation